MSESFRESFAPEMQEILLLALADRGLVMKEILVEICENPEEKDPKKVKQMLAIMQALEIPNPHIKPEAATQKFSRIFLAIQKDQNEVALQNFKSLLQIATLVKSEMFSEVFCRSIKEFALKLFLDGDFAYAECVLECLKKIWGEESQLQPTHETDQIFQKQIEACLKPQNNRAESLKTKFENICAYLKIARNSESSSIENPKGFLSVDWQTFLESFDQIALSQMDDFWKILELTGPKQFMILDWSKIQQKKLSEINNPFVESVIKAREIIREHEESISSTEIDDLGKHISELLKNGSTGCEQAINLNSIPIKTLEDLQVLKYVRAIYLFTSESSFFEGGESPEFLDSAIWNKIKAAQIVGIPIPESVEKRIAPKIVEIWLQLFDLLQFQIAKIEVPELKIEDEEPPEIEDRREFFYTPEMLDFLALIFKKYQKPDWRKFQNYFSDSISAESATVNLETQSVNLVAKVISEIPKNTHPQTDGGKTELNICGLRARRALMTSDKLKSGGFQYLDTGIYLALEEE